ncbi:MAG: hypothetical protein ACLPKB_23520 [Xanthobacteraceae bacterium]
MKRMACLLVALSLTSSSAVAATFTGNSALALAALIAERSPLVRPAEKRVIARLLDGRLDFDFAAGKTISVQADAVVCRVSNVDITSRRCTLTFRAGKIELKGRKAHELFTTVAEAGVPPDGAAGTIYESLSHLSCSIAPNEIKEKAGGGAECKFDPGAP